MYSTELGPRTEEICANRILNMNIQTNKTQGPDTKETYTTRNLHKPSPDAKEIYRNRAQTESEPTQTELRHNRHLHKQARDTETCTTKAQTQNEPT